MTTTRPIDVVARIASRDGATSPLTGARAAFFVVEIVEAGGPPLGSVVLGDVVVLAAEVAGESLEVALVLSRTTVRARELGRAREAPLGASPPAELVPVLVRAARGAGGALALREHAFSEGMSVRLSATVEWPPQGASSGAVPRAVVRDDLARVLVEELPDAPSA